VTVSLSEFTFQMRSWPLLVSTSSDVEWRGAAGNGVTTSSSEIGSEGVEVRRASGVG